MIKIDNVTKQYKLGQIGGTTLKDELQRLNARLHHREDPTKKIGAKDYNKGETFMALNGVSFEVKKGERVGIIGHNGAGKSTLLKLLSRVTAPTSGEIGLNGRITSMLEVGTGFHPELTGRENIYMNGAILGMTRKEIDAKIEDIIEFSECRQFIDTPVKRYSSGMYVKLAFSVAAHLDSEIMIMDEVLAVGDMAFQKKCLDKMNDVSRTDGRTILYVSHNMNTIRQLCDRVIVLDHGKVIFDGDVEEGIGKYLKNANDEDRVDFDCNMIEHLTNCSYDIRINRVLLYDKQAPIYYDDEQLIMRINVSIKKPLSNIFFRYTARTMNDLGIGSAVSPVTNFIATGTFDYTLAFDCSSLRPGKYYSSIGFYLLNKDGSNKAIDHISRLFSFEIISRPGIAKLKCNNEAWGTAVLPEIRIIEKSENK